MRRVKKTIRKKKQNGIEQRTGERTGDRTGDRILRPSFE